MGDKIFKSRREMGWARCFEKIGEEIYLGEKCDLEFSKLLS